MPTTLDFKDILDMPLWRPEAPTIGSSVAGGSLSSDLRNNSTRHPLIYFLRSATTFDQFNPYTGDWMALGSPALAGTFGAGASAVFHPSASPLNTVGTGSTTSTVVLGTALPAAVGVNQLANRGDGTGFRIRIMGLSAGGSGRTEERTIIANTSGTTPTITLDSALSFSPVNGDGYQLLSGRVFLMGAGTTAAGIWKFYDVATSSFSGNLATLNMPGTMSTDTALVALSELHVPNDRTPGTGFVSGGATYNGGLLECIQATAAGLTSITGSGMPSLLANEYAGFQIRVVEDTVNPTAVGRKAIISSHTAGASAVFTTSSFINAPSSSAKFVIENNNEKIVMKTSALTNTYAYNISTDTWDTTYVVSGSAPGAGVCLMQGFGNSRDVSGNFRHSQIFMVRGGAGNNIDVFDVATNTWSNAISYGNLNANTTFGTGTCAQYNPVSQGGRYAIISLNGTQRFLRFDLRNRVLEPYAYLRYPQSTAVVGQKLAYSLEIDGATKLPYVYHLTNSFSQVFSIAQQR